jgi:hypothetical protein
MPPDLPKGDIMSFFVVDIESDGPIPGDFSMLYIGAVRIPEDKESFACNPSDTFSIKLKPLPGANVEADAMNATGLSHEDFEKNGEDPKDAMSEFYSWIMRRNKNGRPILISDNNQFDGMFGLYGFDFSSYFLLDEINK